MNVVKHADGSVSVTKEISGTTYALAPYNNQATALTSVVWMVYSETSTAQRWYLERYCLQKGDMNFDGVLTNSDAVQLYQLVNGSIASTYKLAFFGDITGDGVVSTADYTRLYYFVNGRTTYL